MRFDGKIVLVTGGNSGMGAAAARAFAREGASSEASHITGANLTADGGLGNF